MKTCLILLLSLSFAFSAPIHDYARQGNIKAIQKELKNGVNINIKDPKEGSTPLMYASLKGNTELVKFLIANGANINAKSRKGSTALIIASVQKHKEVIKLLLRYGADINSKFNNGNTALSFASFLGNTKIVKLLIDNGANINTKSNDGSTPLIFASIKGHKEIVKLLLERGARLNIKNNSGNTALSLAKNYKTKNLIYSAYDIRQNYLLKLEEEKERLSEGIINLGTESKKISLGIKVKKENKYKNYSSDIKNYASLLLKEYIKEVKAPRILKTLNLKQKEWELDSEFKQRVKRVKLRREKEIKILEERYRKKVELRNEKLKNINYKIFIVKALNDVLGSFSLVDPKIDRNTGDIYLKLKSNSSNYAKKIKINAKDKIELRKTLMTNLAKIDLDLKFIVDDKNNIKLAYIHLIHNDKIIKAVATNEDFKGETSYLNASISNEIKMQNPNLKHNYKIANIRYKDGRKEDLNYNDDIKDRVNNLKVAKKNSKVWIFSIGIEKYTHTDDIIYANRSAKLLTETLRKKFGVTKGRIISLLDEKATSGAIKHKLKYLSKEVEKGDTIYFYYNGHGINELSQGGEPYILPSDMIPDFIKEEKFYKLKNIYKVLSQTKAKKVIAFIDSCFTGYTDNKSVYKGKAGILKVPKKISFDEKKILIITAGTDKQFSSAYFDKGHRLFTYFLIKELINKKDNNIYSFYKNVFSMVKNTTKDMGSSKQTPTLIGNKDLSF